MFPVDSPWAVNKAFDEFANRCATTFLSIFHRSASDGIDFKDWLYQVAETQEQKVAMLHEEPLYVTADYLGVTVTDSEETAYLALSASLSWNESKVA
jgi:hypothetical protein